MRRSLDLKKVFVLLCAAALALPGCAPGLRVKPEARQVKKVIIVSFYINDLFMNLKESKSKTAVGIGPGGDLFSALKRGLVKDAERERVREGLGKLVQNAEQTYAELLQGHAGWQTTNLAAFDARERSRLVGILEEDRALADFMQSATYAQNWGNAYESLVIPTDLVTGRSAYATRTFRLVKPAHVREKLGALAAAAGADAAAILRLEFGYVDLIDGKSMLSLGHPALRYEALFVDTQGRLIVEETPHSRTFRSSEKYAVLGDYMPITDKNAADYYALVVDTARDLAGRIHKALSSRNK
jgi:hypothetical protein